MFESMWSSMTSSMQLAQECMIQDQASAADTAQPLEGIERFAQIIDSSKFRNYLEPSNQLINVFFSTK